MVCEFAIKKDNVISCRCLNLAHGLIDGKPVNIASPECLKNPDCYYKLWKRALKEKENKIHE